MSAQGDGASNIWRPRSEPPWEESHITRYGLAMEDVRSLREAAGLSQAELARRSGVAQPNLAAYENGRRQPSPEMITRLKAAMRPRPSEAVHGRRDEIRRVLQSHGLSAPRVFGSVARGQDVPGSDLDLLVDIRDDGDVLDLIDAAEQLEELLGCPVEIVTARALRPGHEIERTAVPL